MSKAKWKKLLARELPYPKLTIRADKSIDAALSGLCERKTAPVKSGPNLSLELPENMTFITPEPVKKRPALTAAKWVLAFAALALVSLAALDVISPGTAENLPALGGMFRTINEFFREEEPSPEIVPSPAPDFSPLPVEDNGTRLTGIVWEGENTLVVTGEVPYMGRECYDLFSAYDTTPIGTTASAYFRDGSFASAQVQIEGEQDWSTIQDQKVAFSLADVQTPDVFAVTWRFDVSPKNREGDVVLALFERSHWQSDGTENPGNRVTAEFTIDLSALQATPSGRYREGYLEGSLPMNKAAPEEVLSTPRNGSFTNGWYAAEPQVVSLDSPGSAYPLDCTTFYKLVFYGDETAADHTIGLSPIVDGKPYGPVLPAYSREKLEELFDRDSFTVLDGGFLDESFGNAKWYGVNNGQNSYSFLDFSRQAYPADWTDYFGENYRRVVFAIPADSLGVFQPEEAAVAFASGRVRFALLDLGEGVESLDGAQSVFGELTVDEAVDREREEARAAYAALCLGDDPTAAFNSNSAAPRYGPSTMPSAMCAGYPTPDPEGSREENAAPAGTIGDDDNMGAPKPPSQVLQGRTPMEYFLGILQFAVIVVGAALVLWLVFGRKKNGENRMVGLLDKMSFLRKR